MNRLLQQDKVGRAHKKNTNKQLAVANGTWPPGREETLRKAEELVA